MTTQAQTTQPNLVLGHGMFAPTATIRAWLTPAKRGKDNQPKAPEKGEAKTPPARQRV